MKKFFFCIIMTAASCILAMAQPQQRHHGTNDWSSRMRSEKVGFLTTEIGLTPAEAQVFWPVYNKAEKEKMEAMAETFNAYGEIQKALKEGKGDFSKLVEEYLTASKKQIEIDVKYAKEYGKLLPADKVAKLFVAEERFRREQISKLNNPQRWQQPR